MAKNNKALLLRSAQAERIDVSTNVSLRNLSTFTFEAWVKVGSASGKSQRAFVIQQGGNQKRIRFAFTPIKGKLIFELARRDGDNDTNYTYPMTWDDRWHHVAFAANGPEKKYQIIVDGTMVQEGHLQGFGRDSENKALTISDTAATRVWFGGSAIESNSYTYWDGKLDVVRLWSTVRSTSAILGSMRTLIEYPDNENGLLGEWRLEDTGSSAISAVRPSNAEGGAWTGTLRRNGTAVTNLWDNDRPFLGDFEQDVDEPTVPPYLSSSNVTATDFRLTWQHSTDNVYVQYYEVTVATTNTFSQPVRNWTARQVGRVTSVTVDGLDPATNYYARVRAFDANGNASDFATIGPITTVSVGDTLPPNPPILYAPTNIDATAFSISWSRPTDDVGVKGYKIDVALDDAFNQYLTAYRNRDVGNVQSIYVNEGVPPATTVYVRVRAYDAAENESRSSEVVAVTTLPLPDTQAPSAVSVIEPTAVESTRFIARWLPATDNVAVVGYLLDVSQDADFATFIPGFENRDVGNTLHFEVSPVEEQSTYYYRVRAYDAAGNISENSEYAQEVTTLTKSLAEQGLQAVMVPASESATVRVTNATNLASGTVSTEYRAVRPVGRTLGTSPIESTGRFMLNELGGSVAVNSGRTTYEPLTLPHATYRGPVSFGHAGPTKTGFGADARAVRFEYDGYEFGHVRLPETLPNQFTVNGSINDIYLWVKLRSYGNGGTLIEYASDEQGSNSARVHYDTSGRILVSIYNGDVREVYFHTPTNTLPLNQWTSILVNRSFVSEGNWTNRIFVNGTAALTQDSTGAFTFKHRPVRHLGRSLRPTQVNNYVDGEMFGVILREAVSTAYTSFASMENSAPNQQYLALYRFPIADVGQGRIESYNLVLPIYHSTAKQVQVYHLPNDAWGPSYFGRTELDQRGNVLAVTVSPEADAIELDVTSLVADDREDAISLLVATVNDSTCDGMILGRHDDPNGQAPRLELEVDYNAAVEPRTLTLTPEPREVMNYLPNPSFEAGTANASGFNGAAIAATSVDAFVGSNSLRITASTSATGDQGALIQSQSNLGLKGERVIQSSFHIKSSVEQPYHATLKIVASDGTVTTHAQQHTFTATTGWQRIELPDLVSPAAKTISRFELSVFTDDPNAGVVYIDAAMVTDVTHLTERVRIPYFDASYQHVEPVGTLHNSPSRYHGTELLVRGTYVGDNNDNSTAIFQYHRTGDIGWTRGDLIFDRQARKVSGVVPMIKPFVNYVWNPSAELGVQYWDIGSNAAFNRTTEDAVFGTAAFRLEGTGGTTAPAVGMLQSTLPSTTVGDWWTASVWARGIEGGEVMRLQLHGTKGDTTQINAAQQQVELTNEWQRYEVALQITSDTVTTTRIRVELASGQAILLDGFQLERGEVATEYTDGSEPNGWWAAAPHASPSHWRMQPDTSYDVFMVFDDPDGVRGIGEYGDTIITPPPVDNILTVAGMNLSGGARYIDIEILYTGDDNETAMLSLEWKRTDRTHWSNLSYAWNRQGKRITALLPNLEQNTSYDVRATFSDGTAPIYGENPIVRTRVTPFDEMALVGDAYISFGGFVLLGPNVKNISVIEHDAFSAPEREIQYHSLARVDGEVEQYDIWRRKTVTMTGFISGDTQQELAETLAAFKRAMTARQQRLIIDTLDSRSFYNLATVSKLDIPQRGGENIKHLQWTAEFICADPFRYDTQETVEEDVPLNHGESVLITNTGDVQCEAFYTITTRHTITPIEVTLLNRTSGVRITPVATIKSGDKLEIDTARLRVLKNGVEVDFAGGFPRLVRGSNELVLLFSPPVGTGGASNARLTVRRRHRYF